MVAANGLVEPPRPAKTGSCCHLRFSPTGPLYRDADPLRALDALRRGLVIAQDSGNRFNETNLAANLARLEAEHGDPLAALDHVALAIRNYHDSGNTPMVRTSLAVLAAVLDRLGHREAAATIGGFAISPLATHRSPRSTRGRPPPRISRRPDLRIARPQGRDDDRRRNGDLRIRPNRPGPSRTERCLEIDDI